MARTTYRFKRSSPFFILVGLILIHFGSNPEGLNAQSQGTAVVPRIISSSSGPYSTMALEPISPPPLVRTPQVSGSGAGLTIIPTFNANIDAATQTVINNAIAFYQNTFTNNITVNIEFHNMSTGLGRSTFFLFSEPYSTYCTALAASATSPDDTTALANTPCGATNPINSNANIGVKSPNGRALGLNTPEQSFNFMNSPCPTFTGSGCIGLNVTLANSHPGLLFATVEHEIDEVLGLGSALNGTTTPTLPWTEDLFRWQSAGVRSYAANTSTTIPCDVSTPAAFFSIDGGTTDLDDFNNCANTGDYGDWITHTPSQVQDAFSNASAPASLSISSPEVRALDVIGFSLLPPTHALTVASTDPTSTVAITITPSDNTGQGNGTTPFTRTYSGGVTVTLSAPAATVNGTNFSTWTGCDSKSSTSCTVTINANRTVTANYGPTSPDNFAYQVNAVCGNLSLIGCISPYAIDAATGIPSRTSSPASADMGSAAMAIDPSGKFAYVANASSNDVSMYTIDRITGGLIPIQPCPGCVNTVPAGQAPSFIAIHPSGKFAYVLNSGNSPIFVFTIGTNGVLTQTSSFPGGAPNSIAIHPSGSFVYVADGVSNMINRFAVNPATGDLTLTDSTPVVGFPFGIVLHPSGMFAYALHQSADEVLVFTIDANGKLSATSTVSTGSGSGPASIVTDPLGIFAYVLYAPNGSPGQNITVYTVDSATGALTGPQTFAPVSGVGLDSLTVEHFGKFAYTVQEPDFSCNPLTTSVVSISSYTINRGTGLLAPSSKLCTDFGGRVVVTTNSATTNSVSKHRRGQIISQ